MSWSPWEVFCWETVDPVMAFNPRELLHYARVCVHLLSLLDALPSRDHINLKKNKHETKDTFQESKKVLSVNTHTHTTQTESCEGAGKTCEGNNRKRERTKTGSQSGQTNKKEQQRQPIITFFN